MYNDEAVGYAVAALYKLTEDKEKCKELAREMYWQFDMKTENEADKLRDKILYTDEKIII